MTFARRMSRVTVSPTLKVSAEADRLRRQGVDVVDLGAGEPDFGTPEHVKQAAHAALNANFTKYTPSAGVLELRDAVAQHYHALYGATIKPEEVIVTAGAKQALFNTAFVLFEPGDEVITHGPYWPTIVDQIKLADAIPVVVQTHREDGFAIKASAIIDAITPKTKAIIVNSPCNPTGALIAEAEMIAIADAAAARGIWVIADVTYEQLIYDPVPHNLVKILLRPHARPDGDLQRRIEDLCHDRLALRVDHRSQGIHLAVQRRPGALDLEHQLDHPKGRHCRLNRPARQRRRDAERVSQAS